VPNGGHSQAALRASKGKGKGNFIISIKIQRNLAVVEHAVTNKANSKIFFILPMTFAYKLPHTDSLIHLHCMQCLHLSVLCFGAASAYKIL
jgi:hypothetical protein